MTEPILRGLLQKIERRPGGLPFRTCSDPWAGYALGVHNCCVELWRRGLVNGKQVSVGQWEWEIADGKEKVAA
jgi:hypothetical protein